MSPKCLIGLEPEKQEIREFSKLLKDIPKKQHHDLKVIIKTMIMISELEESNKKS